MDCHGGIPPIARLTLGAGGVMDPCGPIIVVPAVRSHRLIFLRGGGAGGFC